MLTLSLVVRVLPFQVYLPFYSNLSEQRKQQVLEEGEGRRVAPGSVYRNMNRRIGRSNLPEEKED